MTNLTILSNKIRLHDGLYSLNDVHQAAGHETKHTPYKFMRLQQTKELIQEISQSPDLDFENTPNAENPRSLPLQSIQGGAHKGTFVCKELVYAYAMWISPKFHLHVIRAFDAMVSPAPAATLTPPSLPEHQMSISKDRYIELLETSIEHLKNNAPRPNKGQAPIPLTEAEKEHICQLRQQGLTPGEIHKQVGRSRSAVRNVILERLGL